MHNSMVAPEPICPVHGRMHYSSVKVPFGNGMMRIISQEFICKGFDGEGCSYTVDFKDLDWQPVTEEELIWRHDVDNR